MKLHISALLTALCISTAATTYAQRPDRTMFREPHFVEPSSYSLGITLGMSDLWGDVGTKSVIDHYGNDKYWNNLHGIGSIYVRRSFGSAIAARLGVGYGRLYANDDWNFDKAKKAVLFEDDAYQRYLRHQDVRTDIFDAYLVAEVMPLRFNDMTRQAMRRFQPYALLGIGAFYNRPYSQYYARNGSGGGRYIDITTLRLEGQGFVNAEGKPLEGAPKKDPLFHVMIPAGVGVRWDIGEHLALGLEYMYRYTFTDQIDGVSTKYIDPTLFDINLSAQNAAIAKDMYDKSWRVSPDLQNAPGNIRGNSAVNDSYSSISINFFWRVFSRQKIWWR